MELFNEVAERNAGRDTTNLQCMDGVYFHGFCDAGDDLVYTRGPIKPAIEDGIHEVTVYGQKATLFYWTAESLAWPGGKRPRGLVVLDDTESALDAKAKYNRKQEGL